MGAETLIHEAGAFCAVRELEYGTCNRVISSSEHVMHKELISFVRIFREARKIHPSLFIFPV